MTIQYKYKLILILFHLLIFTLMGCTTQQVVCTKSYSQDQGDLRWTSITKLLPVTDSEYNQAVQPNSHELLRRLELRSLSAYHLGLASKKCITLFEAHPQWTDPTWQEILYHLLLHHAITQNQLEFMIQSTARAEIHVKPAIRRGRDFGYQSRATTLLLGKKIRFRQNSVYERFYLNGHLFRESNYQTEFNQQHPYISPRIQIGTRSTAFPKSDFFDHPKSDQAIISYVYKVNLVLTDIQGYQPILIEPTASVTVRVVGKDDQVDQMVTDEGQRLANEQAWINTRVVTNQENYHVLIGFENPPLSQAFKIWIVDGDNRYLMGSLYIPAHAPRQWYTFRRYRFMKKNKRWDLPEKVTVLLEPDTATVDKQLAYTAYWGNSMQRDQVIVDAPYSPAFEMNRQYAQQVIQAIGLRPLVRKKTPEHDSEITVSFSVERLPCRIAYNLIAFDENNVYLNDISLGHLHQRIGVSSGSSMRIEVPKALKAIHLRLVPADYWEVEGYTDQLPWGYPIDFGELVIHDKLQPRLWIHGKVQWPEHNDSLAE